MNNNIIILQTIVPIFFALITVMFASNRVGKILGFTASALNILISGEIIFLLKNSSEKNLYYFVGGINKAIGIALKVNEFNAMLALLVGICACSIFTYLCGAQKDKIRYQETALLLILLAGMNGILFSNDLFNIFVFLELSSIASYALVINSSNKESSHAAFNYLIFGSVAASFYLIGVIFLYNHFGFLNIDLISDQMTHLIDNNSISKLPLNIFLSFFFIICGLLLKIGIFPVHSYLVCSYQKSASHITSFFSGIVSKVNFYILFVILFSVFCIQRLEQNLHILEFLAYLGIVNALIFAFLANATKNGNIKKILVLSSLSQMSYLFILFFTQKPWVPQKAMMQIIFNHGLSKVGLFLLFESFFAQKFLYLEFQNNKESKYFQENYFSNWQRKILDIFFIFFFLHLIGFPPFLGFMGKFSLMQNLFEAQNYIAFLLFLGVVLFSSIYSLHIFFEYFQQKDKFFQQEINERKKLSFSFKIINFYAIFGCSLILSFALLFFLFIL